MKNLNYYVSSIVLTMVAGHSYASNGIDAINNKLYTLDTFSLEPASSQGIRVAKLWFLPDYQENISAGGVSKPSVQNNCTSFNGDGSGRTYIQNPDFNLYNCSGPKSMANRVKCYYGCVCKPAVAFDANSEVCAYKCNGTCVGGVSCKPAVSVGTGEHCTRTCRSNSSRCVAKACNSAVSVGTGEQCTQRCASNSSVCTAKGCKSAVSLSYANDYCTQRCASNSSICTAKSCSPTPSESGCQYGSTQVSNGCGGTRTSCNSCTPLSNETGCAYGTESCSNGCGGTRTCCKGCTPKAAATGCTYGTESCSNGCGGTTTCCKSCTPAAAKTAAQCTYGLVDCSNGCGGTTKCCAGCVYTDSCSGYTLTSQSGCSYGYDSCTACGTTKYKCKACSLTTCSNKVSTKPANSNYTTQSCTDCSGTKTINTGWTCVSGYVQSGSSCVPEPSESESPACTLPACSDKVSSKPANSTYTTSSCTDCNGTKSIKTGWSCNSGYIKSGSTCVQEPTPSPSPSESASPSSTPNPGSPFTKPECDSFYGAPVPDGGCVPKGSGYSWSESVNGCPVDKDCYCSFPSYTAHPECEQYYSGAKCKLTTSYPMQGHSGC